MYQNAANVVRFAFEQPPVRAHSLVRLALVVLLAALGNMLVSASADAGVILGDAGSIGALAANSLSGADAEQQDVPVRTLPDALRRSADLPSGQTGGAGASGNGVSGGSSAVCAAICRAPEPTLVSWLANGQCPFLPPLLPSGLFRPPRC